MRSTGVFYLQTMDMLGQAIAPKHGYVYGELGPTVRFWNIA